MRRYTPVALLLLLLLSACGRRPAVPTLVATSAPVLNHPPPTPPVTPVTATPIAPGLPAVSAVNSSTIQPTTTSVPATATMAPTDTPAAATFSLTAGPGVPAELVALAQEAAARQPERLAWVGEPGASDRPGARLVVDQGRPLARWVYALAAPFATIADETGLDALQAGWQSGTSELGRLVVDQETADAFSVRWGPAGAAAQVVDLADLVAALWAARPSWTLVPFDRLQPELKVLRVDGQSPLAAGFDPAVYPLVTTIGLEGDDRAVTELRQAWDGPAANFDPARLTRVAMTGVTALGRATAYQMEIGGITTPGQVVGPIMQAADLAHVSNEVAFAPDCPYPNPVGDPLFCSRDGYLALLESIGTDVVELTGNHVNDWGPENLAHSLDLYEAAGMRTFGGGRNLAQAEEPALFEHNGNKIAFVGCNPVGPAYAWATVDRAGSRPCDYPAFTNQIRSLHDQGYLVIATLQYSEFYQYAPTVQQQTDFRALAAAGAAAVSGSQGHHAQGFDFYNGAFIHYGLGNLFFDQMDMLGTRQSFVDTYTIYEGRLLSVDLFTSLIENWCCPRAMTAAERADLLQSVFSASGW